MKRVAVVGCGFVADLYMKSLALYPDIEVVGAFDRDAERLREFCQHWSVPSCGTLSELLTGSAKPELVLNLTNPASHYEVTQACLMADCSVYSEKPLAMDMSEAQELHDLAHDRGLLLGCAPCSVLGETAQTLGRALREQEAGEPRLIYAALDDDFISQAPYKSWKSESGAPWPYVDEFQVGCTMEHAGYYLTWLIAWFGAVETVVAASAAVVPGKLQPDTDTPDFSVAILFFKSGMVARLTCSIVAPHDHGLRVFCDRGVLEVDAAWNNVAPVKLRRRFRVRRRLVNAPLAKRLRLKGPTHAKIGRTGAATMNFALGPVEMLEAIEQRRPCRLSSAFALHVNEVVLAIQNAGSERGAQKMTTSCAPMEPMPWAR